MWRGRRDGSSEFRVVADLAAQGVHDPQLRSLLASMFQQNRQELMDDFIAALVALGFRPKLPASIIARVMLATLDGFALHNLFDPPGEQEEDNVLRAMEIAAFSLFEW
jgi:hypothetical protein